MYSWGTKDTNGTPYIRKMDLLMPPAYFPPIYYFSHLMGQFETVFIDSGSNFEKQTIRNRCTILGANGIMNLIIPLKKWSTHRPIDTIELNNEYKWKHTHWRSIMSAYSNSPYFQHYRPEFEQFYEREYRSLTDIDVASIQLIMQLLKVDISLSLRNKEHETENIVDMTRDYSKTKCRNSPPNPPYLQVFCDRFPFTPGLSVLDLLFNLGPQTVSYLKQIHVGNQ